MVTSSKMQEKIDDLRKRRAHILQGGGPDKLEKHRKSGKLTARERVDALIDPESFQEVGLFAEHRATLFGMAGKEMPAEGVVTGAASIGGLFTWRVKILQWLVVPLGKYTPSSSRPLWSNRVKPVRLSSSSMIPAARASKKALIRFPDMARFFMRT